MPEDWLQGGASGASAAKALTAPPSACKQGALKRNQSAKARTRTAFPDETKAPARPKTQARSKGSANDCASASRACYGRRHEGWWGRGHLVKSRRDDKTRRRFSRGGCETSMFAPEAKRKVCFVDVCALHEVGPDASAR